MTVRELAETAGCSQKTVRSITKELFPNLIKNGKATIFNKEQAFDIMLKLPKKNLIQMSKQPLITGKGDKLDRLESMVEQLCGAVTQLITNKPQQIEFVQDYYSILAYSNINNIKLSFSEAIKFGKEASSQSYLDNKEIRKIKDERYGFVNSYYIDVLNKVFSL